MRRLAVAILALVTVAGCTHAKPIPGVVKYPGLQHTHVDGPVTYEQTPPVGGPHNRVWIRCTTYDVPIPNENAVHSMEHGAVWLTYRPDLPQADLDLVHRLLALNPRYVLISPYPGLPNPVVASAWGLQLKVDRADDPRLATFVKKYAGGKQGGEPGTHCFDGATLGQIEQLKARQQGVGTPSGTPAPSLSGTPGSTSTP
jgi:hypothetical protein